MVAEMPTGNGRGAGDMSAWSKSWLCTLHTCELQTCTWPVPSASAKSFNTSSQQKVIYPYWAKASGIKSKCECVE